VSRATVLCLASIMLLVAGLACGVGSLPQPEPAPLPPAAPTRPRPPTEIGVCQEKNVLEHSHTWGRTP
jgi:hypothetical protein